LFATCVPGLAPLVAQEASAAGLTHTGSGFDGRSDVVLLTADRGSRSTALELRTTEDIFIEVGRAIRLDGDDPRVLARRVWNPDAVQRALSVWAEEVRPLAASMTFRVIVRVLHERSFLRTDLRRALTGVVSAEKPRWHHADPAQIEVWMSEYTPDEFVAGLRLTSARMRQHDGRQIERPGALRPTVAAAMVNQAGEPSGTLLDPCCGSGTILTEAFARGWTVLGRDIDPPTVEIARANAPEAGVEPGDARTLRLADETVAACVSNLPFGRRYIVSDSPVAWLKDVLEELVRVTRPDGRVVLLIPEIARSAIPGRLRLTARIPIRLLGTKTSIWVLDRR
jgi:23S rRNA G2445 N2-methylase RlmL